MGDPAEFIVPSEGEGHGGQRHKSLVPIGLHDLLEEALPLIAEDLRLARVRLGITSAEAAERAELDPALYCELEEGSVLRNTDNVGLMMSASRCLGMEEVRFSYVDEVKQYMKVNLSMDGPLIIFIDTLRLNVREFKEQSVFVSPYRVLTLVERIGFYETFASNQAIDKQLIELWVAAVFTLCLSRSREYYVRLAINDPPDVEVLAISGEEANMRGIMLEITRHGSHSEDLFEVIGKKLRKKYEEGTVLVVLVEQAENPLVADLDEFIRRSNPYNQQIFVIGGSEEPGTYKVVPWEDVNSPTPGEIEWLEISVDAKNAGKGYHQYEGVVFKPPGSSFLPLHPMFVKELKVDRQM